MCCVCGLLRFYLNSFFLFWFMPAEETDMFSGFQKILINFRTDKKYHHAEIEP